MAALKLTKQDPKRKFASAVAQIDFLSDEGLEPEEILKLRIMQQSIIDYAMAYKVIVRICSNPGPVLTWSHDNIKYAKRHFLESLRDVESVIQFLHSDWFKMIYLNSLNGNYIAKEIKRKMEELYGEYPTQSRINQIREFFEM